MRFQVMVEAELPTDSLNYHVVSNAVKAAKDVEGMTCEIGVRRGGGSKFIIDALVEMNKNVPHIGIDPFGNIEYFADEKYGVIRQDYSNSMKLEMLTNMSLYCLQKNINYVFFNLEDTEFFNRYTDGVPIYNEVKKIWNKYSSVLLDGPHNILALKTEIDFFNQRMDIGATLILDDLELYPHFEEIDPYLKNSGWNLLELANKTSTNHKASYVKVK